MRVTPGMTADNAVYNLQQRRQAMETLQEQAASGVLVNKPSDNPLTTRQLLDLKSQIASGDQYSSNITKGALFLNVTDTALTGMADLMQQVKKIASTVVGGTTDPAVLAGAAGSLAELKKQLIDLGNTQLGGQYVFGGFDNSTPPFAADGTFNGTTDQMSVEVAQGSPVAINVSGGDLMRGGVAPSAVPGGRPVDILGSLQDLIDSIQANDRAGITDGVMNMDAAADQIMANQTDVASRLVRMTNMQNLITNNQNTLRSVYENMQSVDYAKLGVELGQQTTAFSAALSATAKLTQLSLLDYMR